MGKKGAKKIKEANENELFKVSILIGIVFLLQGVEVYVYEYYASIVYMMFFVGLAGVLGAIRWWLGKAATCEYDENNRLVDGGHPLREGITEYLFDIVYLSLICTVLSFYSLYIWLIFIAVPIFAIYQIYQLLSPMKEMMNVQQQSQSMTQMSRQQRRQEERNLRR